MDRKDRVGIGIMLAALIPGVIGLGLLAIAIEWFEIGYELVRS